VPAEAVGERWTLLIVRDAPDRLTGLVEDGILLRRPDPRYAGRHVYELTAAGRDLWPVLHALLRAPHRLLEPVET
jgi:DNA-binding HxlR family transcriptional regulator